MPKEIIKSKTDRDPTYAHVGWTKGQQNVEVGVINPTAGDIHTPETGWFTSLDRQGCNRLIKAIRQARDQAYGRDE